MEATENSIRLAVGGVVLQAIGTGVRHDGCVPTSPLRAELERRSRPALVVLTRQPRWLVPLLLIALLLVGLFLSGPGAAVPLLVVALFLTWLLLLSWPAIGTGGRVARVVSVLVIVAAAGWRAAA